MSGHVAAAAPVGVFDSGLGGLSVLKHIHAMLPAEDLLYFADSGNAPYGDKTEDEIVARTLAIAEFLLQYGTKAMVVACNTATAAAIKALRGRYPSMPIVGIEPGLKPAAARSKSRVVGVLATRRTLGSEKFNLLREQIGAASGVRFLPQACIGLADQVEKGELRSADTALMLRRYIAPLLEQGADTLVLGCTHYPFVLPLIEEILAQLGKPDTAIVDTGEAVARQLVRLLGDRNLLRSDETRGTVAGFTTGSEDTLARAFSGLLGVQPTVTAVKSQARQA